MTTLITKQLAFNLWANVEIIDLCGTLSEAQLAVAVAGTVGGMQATIAHMISSENIYLEDAGGRSVFPADFDWDKATMVQLLEMAKQTGAALLEQIPAIDPAAPCGYVEDGERYEFPAWTVINQVINHGIEHRTQLRLLLTKLGVPHSGQSVWEFSRDSGMMKISKITRD